MVIMGLAATPCNFPPLEPTCKKHILVCHCISHVARVRRHCHKADDAAVVGITAEPPVPYIMLLYSQYHAPVF